MGAERILHVGQRVSIGGYFGTVRYVGPVTPTKGDWIGVEWDDPSRGKHNGSKDGVVYFECSHETGGSFVRQHKISTGISLVEAIVDRYACSDFGYSGLGLAGAQMYIEDPVTLQKTKVEVVGMEKAYKAIKNLKVLRIASLRMQNVSHVGDEDFLKIQAPNIEELDLSKNLFHEWESIGRICQQFSKLAQLNLSENKLQIPKCPADLGKHFISIRVIILNNCGLTWDDVMACLPMWPHIAELHLDKNQIKQISGICDDSFPCLELLNFSDNPIEDWAHITYLAKLPVLKTMILTNCLFFEAKIGTDHFPSLLQLTLSGNKFADEKIFDQLNNLPCLSELKFRNNPVLHKESEETMREIIIAKIGRLKMLNRSPIDSLERQGAEMDYMKKHGKYWRESGGHQDPDKNNPSVSFRRDHPRYMELVNIHGSLEDEEFLIKSTALKTNLLEITIAVPEHPKLKPIYKKLPHSMTVGSLKVLVSRLLKIPIKEQRLEYVSHNNPGHIVRMAKDNETLYYISLEDGDTINVYPKFSDISWTLP